MKKLLLITLAFTLSYVVNAQITTPQPSPFSKVEQKVGLVDVSIEYSRPAMRGRTIFGNLVPFGKVWRTGANANTKITFSEDVIIGDKTLKAGSYAIFTIPQADKWEVVFYTETGGAAPKEIDKDKVAVSVMAEVMPLSMDIQSFTMSFDDVTSNSAVIGILWEQTYVGVKFNVPTDDAVMASIDKAMSGPSFGDYYAAASYYFGEGKDINKAKQWVDKAMSMTENPRFWQLRQQSLIYAKAGDKAGAIKAAKASLAGAEKAGNTDYVKMNTESIAEWMK